MKQFSLLQAPIMAFFSRDFYRDVAKNWKGLGFSVIFLLLLIFWSAVSIKFYILVNQGLASEDVNVLINQFPTMDVKEGKLTIDKPSPYVVTVPDSENGKPAPLIIFDTTGNTKDLGKDDSARALATSETLIIRKDDESQIFSWKSVGSDFHATPKDIRNVMTFGGSVFALIMWSLGLFVFAGHIILALIYGLLGMIMDRNKLGYVNCVRMASFAMIPTIILSSILELCGVNIPAWKLITIPISLGYLYFALNSVQPEVVPPEVTPVP